jgi:hypothetical protein
LRTVLIVDDDLNFVFWLGNALDGAGFEAFPAKSVPDAIELLSQITVVIDLLIVNAALQGVADFVRCVCRIPARVIAIVEPSRTPPAPIAGADLTILKPKTGDERWKSELLDLVRGMFARDAELGSSGSGG